MLATTYLPHPHQASVPQAGDLAGPSLAFPGSTLIYFQLVFAVSTPLLFLGSALGRMSPKSWLMLVLLWTTCACTMNAMLMWGGGFWAERGALDYSGGYVVHLAAGAALLTWLFMDMFTGPKKANFLGAVNGMIVGHLEEVVPPEGARRLGEAPEPTLAGLGAGSTEDSSQHEPGMLAPEGSL